MGKHKKHKDKASLAGEARYYSSIAGFLGAVFLFGIVLSLCFGLSQLGDGYRIEDNILYLKATPVEVTINLHKASASLVKKNTEWQVAKRINGTGTFHLLTGWCKLDNGKKALVFKHHSSQYMVVIK